LGKQALNKNNWQQIKVLFAQAMELPPAEREAHVLENTGGNTATAQQVLDLIHAHDSAADYLETPITDFHTNAAEREIGSYRILRRLGQGGMGSVYLATRSDGSYEQQVALKILPEHYQPHLLQRFHQERQILAQLDHPHIAHLLDGGSTTDGHPYFVMEYVHGLPLDEYCQAARLDTDQILKLMIDICEAVHFAHQNLIIHRDLKPGNILVSNEGSIKLLDFGIAKLLTTDEEEATRTVQKMMTPDFASPEQILGRPLTTATDIYSLGATLYLLLTGKKPRELSDLTLEDLVAQVSQANIPPPGSIQHTRELKFSADLDAIVMVALHKEPHRRYESARQFADDLQHYLRREAVLAHPDSWQYHSSKFLRKHWLGATATLLIIGMLSAFLAITIRQANNLEQQKSIAETQAENAHLEANRARSISRFLTNMIAAARPEIAQGKSLSVRQMLDHASSSLDQDGRQLDVTEQIAIRDTLAQTYLALGIANNGLPHAQSALKLAAGHFGALHPQTLAMQHNLAKFYLQASDYQQAISLLEKTLNQRTQLLGLENADTASTMNNLAMAYAYSGRMEEALPLDLQQYEITRRVSGDESQATLTALLNVAADYQSLGKLEQATEISRKVVTIQTRVLGATHPTTLSANNNLAILLRQTKHEKEAERIHLDTLTKRRRILGDSHPDTLTSINNLAELYIETQRPGLAQPLIQESYQQRKALLGEHHSDTLESMLSLARIQLSMNKPVLAEQLSRKAFNLIKEHLGYDNPVAHAAAGVLITSLESQHKIPEALKLANTELQHRTRTLGDKHPSTVTLRQKLQQLKATDIQHF
jgi:serine/threonine-protein kinase